LVERVEVAVSPVNGPLLVFEVHHDLVNLQNTKRAKMLIQRKKRRERRKKEERRKKRKEELTVNRFDCAFDSTLVSCATMEASASLICPFFPSCNQKKERTIVRNTLGEEKTTRYWNYLIKFQFNFLETIVSKIKLQICNYEQQVFS